MKCPLCYREISAESQLITPHRIFISPTKDAPDGGSIEICGQCFILVSILDTLKEIKNGITRRSKPSLNN